jgi:hypothetical protein
MARDRFRPGVYLINSPGGHSGGLVVDNRAVEITGSEDITIFAKTQMSFDSGKLIVRWIADDLSGISGAGTP